MNRVVAITFVFIFSLNVNGQSIDNDRKISSKDSILLRQFWTDFKASIEKKDKVRLASLCEFSFYCSPCIDDSTLKNNNHITIKVTKKLFYESQYKLFFSKPILDKINEHKIFDLYIFYPVSDIKKRPDGFTFSYTIVAPSKTWEGMQGFIYLKKINGRYKITGIDTVP